MQNALAVLGGEESWMRGGQKPNRVREGQTLSFPALTGNSNSQESNRSNNEYARGMGFSYLSHQKY